MTEFAPGKAQSMTVAFCFHITQILKNLFEVYEELNWLTSASI